MRLELFIAACALLLSGVVAIASVYQARVIAQQFGVTEQQFSATVWPYVTLTTTSTPTNIQLALTNDGLGPAIVRSAAIAWDGKERFTSWRDMAVTLATLPPNPKSYTDASIVGVTGSLDPGEVIRAGATRSLVALRGWNGFTAALERNAVRHALSVSVCYCSLLGTCWIETWKAEPPDSQQDVEPYVVRRCPAAHGIAS